MAKPKIASSLKVRVIARKSREKSIGEMPYLRPREKLVYRKNPKDFEVFSNIPLMKVKNSRRTKTRLFKNFTPRIKKLVAEFKTMNPAPLGTEDEIYKLALLYCINCDVPKIKLSDLEHWVKLHPWIMESREEHEASSVDHPQTVSPNTTEAGNGDVPETKPGYLEIANSQIRLAVRQFLQLSKNQRRGEASSGVQLAKDINSFVEFISQTQSGSESVQGSFNLGAQLSALTLTAEEQDSFRRQTEALILTANLIRFVYEGGNEVRAQLLKLQTVVDGMLGSLGKTVIPVSHAELLKSQYPIPAECKTEPRSATSGPPADPMNFQNPVQTVCKIEPRSASSVRSSDICN